jgi:hypothetical protein
MDGYQRDQYPGAARLEAFSIRHVIVFTWRIEAS